MANLFKLRKGLDINLAGRAERKKIQLTSNGKYALQPDCFSGVVPKVVVKEGDKVKAGDIAGEVDGQPMRCTIDGVLRGLLPDGTPVHKGMKSGDVDPRCRPEYCTTASDKALAVGGGVLEAILHLSGVLR